MREVTVIGYLNRNSLGLQYLDELPQPLLDLSLFYERLSRRVYYPVAQRNPRFGSNLDQLLVVGSGMTQYDLRFHYLLVLRWHPYQEKRGFRDFSGFHLTHTSSVT